MVKKPKQKRSTAGAKFNICNSMGVEMPLMKELISLNKWKFVENRSAIKGVDVYMIHTLESSYWGEASDLIQNCSMMYNRMPGITYSANKRNLAKICRRIEMLDSQNFDFVPKSFLLPKDYDALASYMSRPNKTFICKPREGS